MKLPGMEDERGSEGEGRRRAHSSSAWNQSKKSIFNLALRVAKLLCQQCYRELITQNCPQEKGDDERHKAK